MSDQILGMDIAKAASVLENARLGDFVRFVSRQDDADEFDFRMGWYLVLGRYMTMATETGDD